MVDWNFKMHVGGSKGLAGYFDVINEHRRLYLVQQSRHARVSV